MVVCTPPPTLRLKCKAQQNIDFGLPLTKLDDCWRWCIANLSHFCWHVQFTIWISNITCLCIKSILLCASQIQTQYDAYGMTWWRAWCNLNSKLQVFLHLWSHLNLKFMQKNPNPQLNVIPLLIDCYHDSAAIAWCSLLYSTAVRATERPYILILSHSISSLQP